MAAIDDLRAELVEINGTTNELATDVDDLLLLVGDGSLTPTQVQEVKDTLAALKTSLQAVAAKHTPATP